METGTATVVRRGLRYYRKSNLAVVCGLATAVAVLAGARVVGESVRASLRKIAIERIGQTEAVIQSGTLFREELAAAFPRSAPMIVLEGLVTHQASGRRATSVFVYGVDDRFWRLHGNASPGLTGREAAASPALARELGVQPGETILVRISRPSDIPAESLFGRKDEASAAIRLNLKTVREAEDLGEFSLGAHQASVRALFVPLDRLQRESGSAGKVNTIVLSAPQPDAAVRLRAAFRLEDLGIRLRSFEDRRAIQINTASGILSDAIAGAATEAARESGLRVLPVMTYMATTLRVRGREVPYALIAALDLAALGVAGATGETIVFNDWTAADLGVRAGDAVEVEYLVWHAGGRMTTETARMTAGPVVRMQGLAGDRDLTPEYPGITDADDVSEWDPPFPMDLGRIKRRDEDYWDRYRTTPKAFIPLERAQALFASRWGKVTALRLTQEAAEPAADEPLARALNEVRHRLRQRLDPLAHGIALVPVRERNLAAARGATDFGEYFGYFSFFLVGAALLLAGLFFRLGIEQRRPQVGLLRAVGWSLAHVRRLFLAEGLVLGLAGCAAGALLAVAYGGLIVTGLRTWWVDAVGTRRLELELAPAAIALGCAAGLIASAAVTFVTLRGLRDWSPRELLVSAGPVPPKFRKRGLLPAIGGAFCAVVLLAASAAGMLPAAAGFFGAGLLLLVSLLGALRLALATAVRWRIPAEKGMARLALRNAATQPGRTIASAALIASATFLIVSVESFRRGDGAQEVDRASGTGGFALIAEASSPLYYDLNAAEGRENLNLALPEGVRFSSFRLRPGDDASCLNLYQPANPRVLGAPAGFLRAGRFSFAQGPAEAGNAWGLLDQDPGDGSIPAIADANSMTYVLHKKLGDEIEVGGVRLRLVAALRDSIFQSELIISERHFLRAFRGEQGYRVFLIDAPPGKASEVAASIENALADYGVDAVAAGDKLAGFHRVENTYLSTFQTLGGLGLVLGTVGLAAVLFRNVLERRRELGLLAAVGWAHARIVRLVLLEHLLLLAAGLATGVTAAALAIAPVLYTRGAAFSWSGMGALLVAVGATGAAATWLSARLALRERLIAALRAA